MAFVPFDESAMPLDAPVSTNSAAFVPFDETSMPLDAQSSSIVDKLKNQPDTSFVSNYGQSFINAANEGRLGIEDLGQSVGKAIFGANPLDESEITARQAELEKIKNETAQSGVVPSGVAGTLGEVAGSIAGSPISWTPLGEVNGISGLAKAGAKLGALTGLTENTGNADLSQHLLNAGVGGAQGAVTSAVLGKGLQAAGEAPTGIANRIKGAFGADTADEIAANSDKNWDEAENYFKSSTANGAILNDDTAANIFQKVKNAVVNLGSRHTDTSGVLSDFENALSQGNVTPSTLHDFRKNLNDVISENTKSKIDGGGINVDGQKALMAKQALDDSLANISENDLIAGSPQAIRNLQQGISSTAQAYSYDKIAQMVQDAKGDAGALQKKFEKFVSNDRNKLGFSDNEWETIKNVAHNGTGQQIEKVLGAFGFGFDKGVIGNVVPAITSGSSAVIPGGLPLAMTGTVLRQTGNFAARGKAQKALDEIMSRDTSPLVNSATNASNAAVETVSPRLALPAPSQPSGPVITDNSPLFSVPAQGPSGTIPMNSAIRQSLDESSAPHAGGIDDLHQYAHSLGVPTEGKSFGDILEAVKERQGLMNENYIPPNDEPIPFAKGGLAKNKKIFIIKQLTVKLGRAPKPTEIELADYVGAHGVYRLLKQKDLAMPAHKMFPQAVVGKKRNLFFNNKKPYSVKQLQSVL